MPCAVVVVVFPVLLPGDDELGELLEPDLLAGFDPLWVVGVSVGVGQGTIVELGFAGLLPCEPALGVVAGEVDWGALLGVCDELCPDEPGPDGLVVLGVADVGGFVGDVGGVTAPVGGFTVGVEVCPA